MRGSFDSAFCNCSHCDCDNDLSGGARPPTADHQNGLKQLLPARGLLQAVSDAFRQHEHAGRRRKTLESTERRLK
eukprot:11931479-Alexandrium_andersonii.AAC.1